METLAAVIASFFEAMQNIECNLFGKYSFSLWDMIFVGVVLGIIGYLISEFLDR